MKVDEESLNLIKNLCRGVARAIIVGDPCPRVLRMIDHHQNPQPGDFVMEMSTQNVMGRFIMVRAERQTHWGENGWWMEPFTYIETLEGELQCWTNCCFYAFPDTKFWGDEEIFQGNLAASDRLEKVNWAENAKVRHGLV